VRETIAAIASGMTASGIGIIRISGPDAFRVLGKVFRFANKNKTVENVRQNTIHYGHIIDYEVGSRSDGQVINKRNQDVLSDIEKDDGSQSDGNHVNTRNQNVLSDIETDDVCRSEEQPIDTLNRYVRNETVIDEVLVMIMKGPHTYTAEDTVEIDCHGGPFVMQKILSSVLKAGARAAEPGEFTKRAFLNGRIDLTEAEAVMEVISSGSEDALKSSLMQLDGSVRREIESLRERILTELAYIEAALDDP
jgi:tRNA U34 5-carboxymethylaminomethyl modifying GTPase MnmE/TrmE